MTARRNAGPVLLIGLALAAAGCSGNTESPSPSAETLPLPAGERLTIGLSKVPDMATVPATVTTRDMADARARIPGVLTEMRVRAGDRVAAGQRIGTIADTRLAQESAALGASVAAAEAEAQRAAAELKRIRYLHAERVYADARLEDAVAGARAAEAGAAAARAQQGAVAALAAQGAVLAPASGRILRADIPAGSAVAPGMSIATITAGPPVIRLELPESLGARIAPGAPVSVTGLAGRPADARHVGAVAKVYPAVSGGKVQVDATVADLDPSLIGQRVTAQVQLGERRSLSVPARFITQRFGLSFATLLSADGKRASEVPVEVRLLPGGGAVEILSGLNQGDIIIVPTGGKG